MGQYTKKKPITAALEFDQYNRLKRLSQQTRIPMQEYLRESADLVLTKHEGSDARLGTESSLELMQRYSAVVEELKRRAVIRSKNLTGDYAEYLAARTLGLELAANSTAGFDGTDESGTKYQVKGRQWTHTNRSRQLSVIRHLDGFDQLVAIVFDPDWAVDAAAIIPPELVRQFARANAHQNGYILHARDDVMKHKMSTDITRDVIDAQQSSL